MDCLVCRIISKYLSSSNACLSMNLICIHNGRGRQAPAPVYGE
jgi:hypothetical protein